MTPRYQVEFSSFRLTRTSVIHHVVPAPHHVSGTFYRCGRRTKVIFALSPSPRRRPHPPAFPSVRPPSVRRLWPSSPLFLFRSVAVARPSAPPSARSGAFPTAAWSGHGFRERKGECVGGGGVGAESRKRCASSQNGFLPLISFRTNLIKMQPQLISLPSFGSRSLVPFVYVMVVA